MELGNAIDNRQAIANIRRRMLGGVISYEQARAEAQPIIDGINAQAKIIAKRHGKKPQVLYFAAIMR